MSKSIIISNSPKNIEDCSLVKTQGKRLLSALACINIFMFTQHTQARAEPELFFIPKSNFYIFSQLPLEGKTPQTHNYNMLGFYTKCVLQGIFEIGYRYQARLINQCNMQTMKDLFAKDNSGSFDIWDDGVTYQAKIKEFHDYHAVMLQIGNIFRIVGGTFPGTHLPEQIFADIYNYGTHLTYHSFDISREQEQPLYAWMCSIFLDNVILDSINLKYTGVNAIQACASLDKELKQEAVDETKEATASNGLKRFIYKEEKNHTVNKTLDSRFTLSLNNVFDNRLGTIKNTIILATEMERIGYKFSLTMDDTHVLDEFTFKISLAQSYIILRRGSWNLFISASSIKEIKDLSTESNSSSKINALSKDWKNLSGGRSIVGQLYYKKPMSDTHSLYIGISFSFNLKQELFLTRFEESKPSIHFNIGLGETTDELSSALIM